MMKFFEKFRPCKVVEIEEPSVWSKIGKGVLITLGVVAGIAAVFTAVEVILVKVFKKCITFTIQCTDLSNYDEDEECEEECEVAEGEDAAEETIAE